MALFFLFIMSPTRHLRKTNNRLNLYSRVRDNGIIMPSCSRCLNSSPRLHCLVSSDSDRCAECIRAGGNVSCDVWGPSKGDWERLRRSEEKISTESDIALSEQQRLLAQLAEVSARLVRLEKHKKMFRSRAADMLQRGLKSLDELDAVEAKEREETERERQAQEPPASSSDIPMVDPLADLDPVLVEAMSHFDPSDPFWASPDIADGTTSTNRDS